MADGDECSALHTPPHQLAIPPIHIFISIDQSKLVGVEVTVPLVVDHHGCGDLADPIGGLGGGAVAADGGLEATRSHNVDIGLGVNCAGDDATVGMPVHGL